MSWTDATVPEAGWVTEANLIILNVLYNVIFAYDFLADVAADYATYTAIKQIATIDWDNVKQIAGVAEASVKEVAGVGAN